MLLAADPSRPDGRGGDLPTCSPAQTTGYRSVRRGVRALGDAMRKTLLAALTVLLVSAPAAQADGGHGGGELREYAKGTWASFVAMTDERSGLPADILNEDGTTSVQTSTTNIGAYMWSAVAAEELGFIRKHELVARLSKTLVDARRDGARHRQRPVLQLVRPPHGREAHGLAANGRAEDPDPVLGRQRLAGDRSEDRREQRPAALAASGKALRLDELRRLLQRRPQPDPLPHHARRPGGVAVLLRHRRQREPDRRLHRRRPGLDPGQGVLRTQPLVAGHVRSVLDGDQAGRQVSDVPRRAGVRGRAPVRGHAGRPVLERLDVRGADAGSVRARGPLGTEELGREPPADRARADPPRPA